MSRLARFGSWATAPTLLAAVGLAATAAVLIALSGDPGCREPRSPRAARPVTNADTRHGAASGTFDVSPEPAVRAFASSYVSLLYGRRAAHGVAPVARALSRRLLDGPATATPAELSRDVVVRDLAVIPRTGTTATANAVVDDGASPPYALSFTLTLIRGRWLVTAVETDGR